MKGGERRGGAARTSERDPATGAPQRNFDMPAEERVRAIVAGPPAFARRLRAIEDLEEAIVRELGLEAEGSMRGSFVVAAYAKLQELTARHNRYYPIEADLPTCPRTEQLLDRGGRPWRPRSCPSLDELRARGSTARATSRGRCGA
jgi:hypothetical protein